MSSSSDETNRQSRLSFRKFGEHQLRREFKDIAMEKCRHPEMQEFAECAEQQGLLVIFNCRKYHKAVQECMAYHNSNAAFEEYKQKQQSKQN
eukprot:CAMPEP_0116835242 /NCGR_PEP_ID=MMETSP0418-20121206/7438_1 /TAXON_ID=1158023 /ORGANISM="Astrosyne radiata, Strain 13vi08-1A" /LENGTH=91 /DNA_ID=CAMNT_0004464891 /DNA_START=91 /DNA_END=366 /DNA_ORIENTATION=-